MNRRSGWLIGTVVAVAVVGSALFHRLGATGSMSSRTPASQRQLEVGEQNGGVAYGDTAKQVLAKLGVPTERQSGCWIYHADAHAINGEYLGKWFDGLKFCFADGPAGGKAVATIFEHILPTAPLAKNEYPAGGWIHAFTINGSPTVSKF